MRSKGATIIFGGLLLSSLLVVLVAGIIQAQTPPGPAHEFTGKASIGGTEGSADPLSSTEIRVKNADTLAVVIPDGLRVTNSLGLYGLRAGAEFRVLPNGVSPGDELLFFLLRDDGAGEVGTVTPVKTGDGDVDIVLEPRSSQFYEGVPFLVDVKVKPRGGATFDSVNVSLSFDPLALRVESLSTGDSDNQAGTVHISAAVDVEALLATITFIPTGPQDATEVVFNVETAATAGSTDVTGNLFGMELVRMVQAITHVGGLVRFVRPVIFIIPGVDDVNLYIFGPPENLRLDASDPVGDPRPTLLWDSPTVGGIPDVADDVLSYQVRILPEDLLFSDIGNTISFTPDNDLAAGVHNFQVRAVGVDGRVDAIATLEFTVGVEDAIPPAAPVLDIPVDDAAYNTDPPITRPAVNRSVFRWFNVPEAEGVVEYRLQIAVSGDLAAGPYIADEAISYTTTTKRSKRFTDPLGLVNTRYQWRVVASDAAGNTGSSETRVFTYDTILPEPPTNLTEVTTEEEEVEVFTWTRSVDPVPSGGTIGDESGVDFYRIVIPGAAVADTVEDASCDDVTNVCQYTSPPLSPGTYTIEVSAVDRAANEGLAATAEFDSGPKTAIRNLTVLDPVFVDLELGGVVATDNPRFQWSPPAVFPAGLTTYEVAITGDALAQLGEPFEILPFTPFTGDGVFSVECFGSVNDTGDSCAGATGDDVIILTVLQSVVDGTHQLGVRIVNGEGQRKQPVNITFTVDTIPPTAPVLVRPEVNEFFNTGLVTFAWDPSAGDVFGYRLQVIPATGDFDTGPYRVDRPLTGDVAEVVLTTADQLGDGTYRWRVVARDQVLNTADSETRTFTVDIVAPASPVLVRPDDGTFFNTDPPITTTKSVFRWRAAPEAEGVVGYRLQIAASGDLVTGQYLVDLAVTGDNRVVFPTNEPLGLDNTRYQWRVVASDAAGNTGSSETWVFTYDTILPEPPTNLTEVTTEEEEVEVFTWTQSVDPVPPPPGTAGDESGVDFYRVVIPGAVDADRVNTGDCDDATNVCRYTSPTLAPGSYNIQVSAVDRASNKGLAATADFRSGRLDTVTVVNIDPIATILSVSDTTPTTNQSVTFTGTGDDLDGTVSTADFLWDFGDGTTATGDVVSHSYTSAGSKTVTLTVTDNEGGEGKDSVSVTVSAPSAGGAPAPAAPVNETPTADAGNDRAVNEGDTVFLDGTGSSDPDGGPESLTFSWSGGVSLSGAGTSTPSFTASDGPETLTFTLTVGDGLATSTDTVAVTVRNVAPTITSVVADPSAVDAGGTSTITVSATDPAGAEDPLEYSFDCDDNGSFEIGPQAGNSASCTITETPAQTVNVRVEDGDDGVAEDDVSVSVRSVAPTVDAGDDATINEGETFIRAGSFTDSGTEWTATVDYGDGSGVEDLVLSGKAFRLSHEYADNGEFDVVVEVTDEAGGTGQDTVTVTVNNVAPDVEDIADASTDEGETFSAGGSFLDPGTDTWTATVDYGDGSGSQSLELALDSTFSLSHVYEDNGTFTVTVTVNDNDLGSDTTSLTVDVSNVAPEVDAGDDQSAFAGDTVQVSASFSDAGAGDTHTATIDWDDGTVESGTVDAGAGTITGSHEYATAGSFTVTVTVNDDDLGSASDTLTVEVLISVAKPGEIDISDFELSTTEPVPPETVTVSFTVTNISEAAVTLPIDLFQNGVVVHTFAEFTLGPDEARVLERTLSERQPATYAVQVFDQVRNYTIAAPQASISGLVIAPRVAGPRDTVTISAEVTNIGAVAGRFEVDIQVDGNSAVQQLRLIPGDSQTIVRLVNVPAQPPSSGIASTGPHSVGVEGLRGTYVIRPPDIQTEVQRARRINRDTSKARGAGGEEIEIIEGDVVFGEGSITFSLPVRAPRGVKVASFTDATSGINIIGRDVQVPVRDPNTGVTILNLVGILEEELEAREDGGAVGTFQRLSLQTEERLADLSADDPNVGRLGVSLNAVLDEFPAGVVVEATIKKELDDAARTAVEQAARQEGKTVANEAGMVSFETTNLDPVDDVGEVSVTMKVSAQWVNIYGEENVRIAHVADDGSVENLVPICTGPDRNNQYTCVGTTQRGLSEFSLLALVDIPPDFSARNLEISPPAVEPGQTAKITVEIVNEGVEAGSFSAILNLRRDEPGESFQPIAVQEITLAGRQSGTVTFFVLRDVEGQYEIEVEGRVGEFLEGGFGVFRRLDPANLRFTDLIVTPTEALPGEPVRISFLLANEGEQSGRTEVELRINQVLVELRSLSVPGRDQVLVVFQFVAPAEGEFDLELIDPDELVASLRGKIVASIPELPATFSFERPSITPLEVGPGQELTISARLTNFGDLEGALTAILTLDGVEVGRQDVFRDPLFSGLVTFTINAPLEPGSYTVRLGGEVLVGDPALFPVQGTFRVLEAPREIIIESLRATPDPVKSGAQLTISVVLTNTTDQEDVRVLTLKIDGETVVRDVSVILAGGETRTEVFTVDAPTEEGTHVLEIEDGPSIEFDVEVVVVLAAVLNLVAPMSIDPVQVSPGDLVTIRVLVRNDGGEAGSTDVILRVRGTEVDRKTVEIAPGDEERVEFQLSRDEVGDYDVEVEAEVAVDVPLLTGSFSVVGLPVDVEVEEDTIGVEPSSVESGNPVVISADVTNSGTVEATETIVLMVDGVKVDEQTITLAAGETTTVTFTYTEDEVGTHRATINGVPVEFEVTEVVPDAAFPIIIIIVVVIVVVVIAGVGGFLLYRRRAAGQAG